MSQAIQFLEMLGRAPAPFVGQPDAYAAAVAALDVEESQRAALLGRDSMTLGGLLDGRARMICAVCTPDDAEPESAPGDDGDGDGVPDDQEPPTERQ